MITPGSTATTTGSAGPAPSAAPAARRGSLTELARLTGLSGAPAPVVGSAEDGGATAASAPVSRFNSSI
ncbi:hypothetical protein [Phaeacidiphilus oryzae]|uniref:hypothetical protein n=1 Tax=Phaeacidiphilus oryzae TaxID=348818 RepID=UPI00055E1436|nr:hypothetical protein [Phaeacidiphilus oryzae]